jgi:CheY-like chemotaxis protein
MKILIIEDSRAVAAVMAARLSSLGHEVDVAENGAIGVDKFETGQPDLVFMDIEMPVMNGFEATNRIRAHEAKQPWAWTPIIFLTASDTAENLITAIEAGGDDFMSKSVPELVLEAKMKAMARIAALRQRLSFANRKLEEQASRDGLTGLANHRHLGILPGYPLGRFTPQTRGFQHVGLVDDRQFAAARHGQPERHVQDPFDLRDRVGAGVEGARALLVAALRTAEVNAAREFAHDDHVKASSRDVCAQGRKTVESREDACRTQVAKELVALAQRQKRPRFRTLFVREMIPLRAADAAKENGFSSVTGCNCFFRKRRAAGINGGAAHEFFRTFNGKAEFACGGIKYAECLAHNFGADAVAG